MKFKILGIGLLSAGTALIAQSPGSAYLKTNVDPGRAGVFVDGKYQGPATNFRQSAASMPCRPDPTRSNSWTRATRNSAPPWI